MAQVKIIVGYNMDLQDKVRLKALSSRIGNSMFLVGAIGICTLLNIANRRQETAPTSACFKSPKA